MSEYKSPYAANIGKMYNAEVVALAKNRFTDEETQVAIAKHYYSLGRQYLTANPEFSKTPAALLEEIYHDVTKDETRDPEYYAIERFVAHPNCSLELALRISTMKIPEHQLRWAGDRWERVKHKALMRAAEITKREGATSR